MFKDKPALLAFLNSVRLEGQPELLDLADLADGVFFGTMFAHMWPAKFSVKDIAKSEKEHIRLKNWIFLDKLLCKEGFKTIQPQKVVKGRFYELNKVATLLKEAIDNRHKRRNTIIDNKEREKRQVPNSKQRKIVEPQNKNLVKPENKKDTGTETEGGEEPKLKMRVDEVLFSRLSPEEKINALLLLMGHHGEEKQPCSEERPRQRVSELLVNESAFFE